VGTQSGLDDVGAQKFQCQAPEFGERRAAAKQRDVYFGADVLQAVTHEM
jgi:hypothetical protein